MVTEAAAKKLRLKESNLKPMKWTTPAGEVSTKKTVKTQITLPEFYHDRIIEWDYHVAKSLGMYDMIIGRDMLEFLGVDIRFSTMTVEWDSAEIPFKDISDGKACFHVSWIRNRKFNLEVSSFRRDSRAEDRSLYAQRNQNS